MFGGECGGGRCGGKGLWVRLLLLAAGWRCDCFFCFFGLGYLTVLLETAELFAGAIGSSGATYTTVEAINTAAATIGGA